MENVLTASRTQQVLAVNESIDIGACRRAASDLARDVGFHADHAARLALVVSEVATNVYKHAGRGEILMRTVYGTAADGARLSGIELLAIDGGPGIADISASMADGTSTGGTYGVGMGTIERQSDAFAIYSVVDQGTVVRAVVWERKAAVVETWQCGLICVPMPSEQSCGDAAWCAAHDGQALLMVSDGLGHGDAAAAASDAALEIMQDAALTARPADLLQRMHPALQRSRGAALAVASIVDDQVAFAGVGNIAGCTLYHQQRKHLISHNGIVGHNLRKVQQFTLPWQDGMLLLMHSDGLGSRWNLDDYPGLENAHPALIAGVLYRDFYRGRDDITVLVLRKE